MEENSFFQQNLEDLIKAIGTNWVIPSGFSTVKNNEVTSSLPLGSTPSECCRKWLEKMDAKYDTEADFKEALYFCLKKAELNRIITKFGLKSDNIVSPSNSKPYPILSEKTPKIWIHCALTDEMVEAKEVFEKRFSKKFEEAATAKFHYRMLLENNDQKFLICLSSNPGNQHQGSQTNPVLSYIKEFHPLFVFMVGICAGNPELTNRGDVIVFSKSTLSHKGTLGPRDEIRHDADYLEIAASWQDRAMTFAKESWTKGVDEEILNQLNLKPKIEMGDGMCSDLVRNDIKPEDWAHFQTELSRKKLYGVECEAFHLYQMFPGRSLCVKGVQDTANNKGEDTKKYRKIGCQLSAAYVATYIEKHHSVLLK